jgi:hypothetical protein
MIKTNVFILFIFSISVCHYLVPKCNTEVEVTQVTRYGTKCHNRHEKVCKMEYETENETEYRQQCEETQR